MKKIYFIIPLTLLIIALFVFISRNNDITRSKINSKNVLTATTDTLQITQSINTGKTPHLTNTLTVKTGTTALDILTKSQKVIIKDTSLGKLVDSIDDVKNGTDNKYWIFYINGKQASIGADKYKLQNNDSIEWRFQTYEE